MVAAAVLSIVIAIFASTMIRATDMGKSLTADADLRAKTAGALSRIVQDLRSTQPGTLTFDASTPPRSVSFLPMTGVNASGAVFATTTTSYSWDPNQTTAGTWTLSRLNMTPYTQPGLIVPVIGEVTDFSVIPLGTTVRSGFSNTTPLPVQVSLELSRHVFQPNTVPNNPTGKLSVRIVTIVVVPGAAP